MVQSPTSVETIHRVNQELVQQQSTYPSGDVSGQREMGVLDLPLIQTAFLRLM
jgi:hypothetical protein